MFFAIKPLVFLSILLTTVAAPPNVGELISVYAEGLAEVEESNLMEARKKAREMAVSQALWNVIDTLITEGERDYNMEELEEIISSKSMRFVQSYKFIDESLDEEAELYTVSLELTLFYGYLRQTLTEAGMTVEGGGRLKVVVVIDERAVGVVPDSSFLLIPSATEESLRESVSRLGYYVIDRKQVRDLKNDELILEAVRGDTDAVLWLSEKFEATYVIMGSAKSKTHPAENNNPAWVEGEIYATIYDGTNAEVLWREQVVERLEKSSGATGFRAIRMAGKKLDSKVIDFIYSRTR